jgi:hypothetical protein
LIEQALGAAPGDHRIGDRVGVALVRIAAAAIDATFVLNAAALLHHVRGLVRRGVKVGGLGERDRVAVRVRLGAERARRLAGLATDMGLDARDVVAAEQALDPIAERQGLARAARALRCDVGGARATAQLFAPALALDARLPSGGLRGLLLAQLDTGFLPQPFLIAHAALQNTSMVPPEIPLLRKFRARFTAGGSGVARNFSIGTE